MNAAPCSWRVVTWVTDSWRRSASRMSIVSSPGTEKTYRQPSAARHSTRSAAAVRAGTWVMPASLAETHGGSAISAPVGPSVPLSAHEAIAWRTGRLTPDGQDGVTHRDGRGLAALALTVAFLVVSVAVGTGALAALDTRLAPLWVLELGTFGRKVAESINQAGELPVAGLVGLAGLVLAGVQRRPAWLILLAPMATIPIELLAKNLVPQTGDHNFTEFQIGSLLAIPTPYTFPSGSMARVTALVVALLVHRSRERGAQAGRDARVATIVSALALTVAAWGHFAVGDHWASDIFGGLILGAAAAFALAWLTGPRVAPGP